MSKRHMNSPEESGVDVRQRQRQRSPTEMEATTRLVIPPTTMGKLPSENFPMEDQAISAFLTGQPMSNEFLNSLLISVYDNIATFNKRYALPSIPGIINKITPYFPERIGMPPLIPDHVISTPNLDLIEGDLYSGIQLAECCYCWRLRSEYDWCDKIWQFRYRYVHIWSKRRTGKGQIKRDY